MRHTGKNLSSYNQTETKWEFGDEIGVIEYNRVSRVLAEFGVIEFFVAWEPDLETGRFL